MQIPNERVNEVIAHLTRRVATLEQACRRALNCFAIVSQTDGLDEQEQSVYDALKRALGDEPDGMLLVVHHVPKEPEPPEGNVIDFTAVLDGIQAEQEATEWYNTWRLAMDAGVGQLVTAEGEIVRIEEGNAVTYEPGDPTTGDPTNGKRPQ
jgi:hypothetical protein